MKATAAGGQTFAHVIGVSTEAEQHLVNSHAPRKGRYVAGSITVLTLARILRWSTMTERQRAWLTLHPGRKEA